MQLFDELTSDYYSLLRSRGRSVYTVRNYRDTLSRLRAYLEAEKPEALDDVTLVTHRTLQRWLGDCELSQASVAKMYRDARAFFSWLVTEEELPRSPMERVERPREDARPVPVIDAETFTRLLGAGARTKRLKLRNDAVLLTLLDTGVRASELLNMKCDDFQWERNVIRVSGKTGTRDVPFSDTTARALRKYRRHRESQEHWFWVGQQGPLGRQGLRTLIDRCCASAGVEHVDVKSFRHTFAHLFLLNGGDLLSLQSIGGWSSVKMLQDTYGRSGREARALVVHSRVSPVMRLGT